MTEKRPTPEAAAGKRAVPTIDLTATEIPPVTSEADPPPPDSAASAPPQAAAPQAAAPPSPEPEPV
ncbi:MAG TPA: hypothetical protein VGC36_13045, partial [Rhizomicrobium sp.]